MTLQDITVRCVEIAKEKMRITKHRVAREREMSELTSQRAKLHVAIKCSANDIQKSINMLCELDGEQRGLLANLSIEDRQKVIEYLKPFALPKRSEMSR